MHRLARSRYALAIVAALLALGVGGGAKASPGLAPAIPSPNFADSDGDGIPDDLDPDDDNDGVADGQHADPQSPSNSGQDADQDTIPDSHDPDDNNNGVTDDDEASADPPDTSPGPGTSPGSDDGPSQAPVAAQSNTTGSDGPALVRSLPVTGTGSDTSAFLPLILATTSLALALGGCLGVALRHKVYGSGKP